MKRYSMHPAYDNVGLSCDDQGDYVLHSEAQARIEALEWLVEVERLATIEYFYDSVCLNGDAEDEFYSTLNAARAAVEQAQGGVKRAQVEALKFANECGILRGDLAASRERESRLRDTLKESEKFILGLSAYFGVHPLDNILGRKIRDALKESE